MSIPELKAAYADIAEAVKHDRPEEYKEALAAFRRTTLLNGDLLYDHAKRLVAEVRTRMDELMGATMTAGTGVAREVPEFSTFHPFP